MIKQADEMEFEVAGRCGIKARSIRFEPVQPVRHGQPGLPEVCQRTGGELVATLLRITARELPLPKPKRKKKKT